MITITVCMGSSCFSRGNTDNAEIIQNFVKNHVFAQEVVIKGCLCEGKCKTGPHVRINDQLFDHVAPEGLEDLLTQELGPVT
jgi:NADH:ubiquinone oxidoreductase subunit E